MVSQICGHIYLALQMVEKVCVGYEHLSSDPSLIRQLWSLRPVVKVDATQREMWHTNIAYPRCDPSIPLTPYSKYVNLLFSLLLGIHGKLIQMGDSSILIRSMSLSFPGLLGELCSWYTWESLFHQGSFPHVVLYQALVHLEDFDVFLGSAYCSSGIISPNWNKGYFPSAFWKVKSQDAWT